MLLMLLMAAAAEAAGIKEIIFPEAAALLLGSFIMPEMPWNVRHVTMTVEMTLCAAAGILISRYVGLPVYFKMLLAAAFVFVLLTASGNTLTPSVSACMLPVLIGATEWIYVLSVAVTAAVCDAGSFFIERRKPYDLRRIFVRNSSMRPLWSRMFVILAVILLIPGISGELYLTAPPLVVAFIALSGQGMAGVRSANPPFQTILVFFLTSMEGFLFRLLSDETAVPAAVCVMLAAAAAWAIIRASGRSFPPAAALAVLPFILPAEGLFKYPVEVTCGIALYYCGALAVGRWMKHAGAAPQKR